MNSPTQLPLELSHKLTPTGYRLEERSTRRNTNYLIAVREHGDPSAGIASIHIAVLTDGDDRLPLIDTYHRDAEA